MTRSAVEVVGARELRRSLKRLGDDLGELKAAHRTASGIVVNAARKFAPVGPTGRLAASIRPGASNTAALVRAGGARVPYANAVHWGTGPRAGRPGPHNIAPSRFVTRAAAETEAQWLPIYEAAVDAAVARVEGA